MPDPAPPPIQDRLAFDEVRLRPRPGGPSLGELRLAAANLRERLQLVRPLVFIDLEATGVDPLSDRIVELFVVRVEVDGAVAVLDTLVDPGVPIPGDSTRVHGIDDQQVSGAPSLAEIAPALLRTLRGADVAGYNLVRYDLPLLRSDLARGGYPDAIDENGVIDACLLFKRMERRDLASAVRFYCEDEQQGAHTAAGDAFDTMRVLAGQLQRYPQLPREVSALDLWLRPPAERR